MNRKSIFAALACALLVFSMLGCGTTNHLQSIQLSTSNVAEVPMGTLDLYAIGWTIQLYPWGNYSSGVPKLLTNEPVTYQIVVTADNDQAVGDDNGIAVLYPLSAPPDTVEVSTNGLITAVQPAACTFLNTASPPATAPAWAMVGSYTVTATYHGFTSPPVFVAVASGAGIWSTTNPNGYCGPQPTS